MNPKDPSNFRQMLLDSPDQFKVGFELAKDIKLPGIFSQMVVSGMGGSALPVNILRIYLTDLFKRANKKPFEVYINRSYDLPLESFGNCLNIISSYSGNTEETISCFHQALEKKLPCIAVSAGGKLEEIAKANNVPHIKLSIPFPNFQPRVGTGYFFASLLQILINQGLVEDEKENLLSVCEDLKKNLADVEKRGQELAKTLSGKTPIVYVSEPYKHVAMVWKIKINENAKTPAYWNFFPELNHNEMVGYTNPQAKFHLVMIKDPADNPQDLKRYDATAKLVGAKGVTSTIIEMQGSNVFYKIFWSILLADFTSYNLALEYSQDPTPVDMVEELKAILVK